MRVREKKRIHLVVYNKREESKGKSPDNTRLEIQFTNYYGITSARELLLAFCKELDAMLDYIEKVNQVKIDRLSKEFERRKSGKHPDGTIADFKAFVAAYSGDIFNRDILKGLDSLYSGCADSKNWLQKYPNMILIPDSEIKSYLGAIKRGIKIFVKSNANTMTFCQNETPANDSLTRTVPASTEFSTAEHFTNIALPIPTNPSTIHPTQATTRESDFTQVVQTETTDPDFDFSDFSIPELNTVEYTKVEPVKIDSTDPFAVLEALTDEDFAEYGELLAQYYRRL